MRRLVYALACVALLTACDDGESIDPEADEERIEDALLTIDDLPDGFEETEASDDDDEENPCNEDVLEIDPDELDDNESAKTDAVEFSTSDRLLSVTAEITAFRDTELPERVLAAVREEDDDYLECLEERVADELEGDSEVGGVEVVDSPVDDGGALQIEFETSGLGVVIQQHAVIVDRFGVSLQVTAVDQELDEDLVEDALDAMIERLEEAED